MTYARGEMGSPQGEMRGLTPQQMNDFSNANIIKKVCNLGMTYSNQTNKRETKSTHAQYQLPTPPPQPSHQTLWHNAEAL